MHVFVGCEKIISGQNKKFYEDAYQALPLSVKKYIDCLQAESRKRESICAYKLLQEMLLSGGVSSFQVRYMADGKPKLRGKNGVYFNLSHSGDQVICALAGFEVGCDIEKICKGRERVAERFFHEKEIQYLSKREKSERTEAFFTLWTMKESLVKATGKGLRIPLDSFSVVRGERLLKTVRLDGKTYHVKTIEAPSGYQASVAVEIVKTDKARQTKTGGRNGKN